jgi:hypothetical protein
MMSLMVMSFALRYAWKVTLLPQFPSFYVIFEFLRHFTSFLRHLQPQFGVAKEKLYLTGKKNGKK